MTNFNFNAHERHLAAIGETSRYQNRIFWVPKPTYTFDIWVWNSICRNPIRTYFWCVRAVATPRKQLWTVFLVFEFTKLPTCTHGTMCNVHSCAWSWKSVATAAVCKYAPCWCPYFHHELGGIMWIVCVLTVQSGSQRRRRRCCQTELFQFQG